VFRKTGVTYIYIYIHIFNRMCLDIRYGRIYGLSYKERQINVLFVNSLLQAASAVSRPAVFQFSRVVVFVCTRARTKVQGESVCDGLCNDALGDSSRCVTGDRPSIRRRRGSSPHRDRLHLRIQSWLEGRFRRPEAEPEEVTRSRRA